MAGRNVITTRITLEGAKELIEQLKQIGEKGAEGLKHIQEEAKKVQGPPTAFQDRMKAISDSLKTAGQSVVTFGKQVTAVGAGFSIVSAAVAGTVVGFGLLAKTGAEAADEMLRNAQSAGLTIEEFAKLSTVAKAAEIDTGTFTTAMARLSKNIVAAAKGSGEAAKVFGDLKVKIEEGGKIRPTIDIVTDLVGAFNKLPDGAKKSASAMALFGRGGAQLIPLLNTSSQEVQHLFEEVERLGLGFTKAEAQIGDKFSDTVELVFSAVTALRNHIGLIFVPTLQKVADATLDFIAAIREPLLAAIQGITDAFNSLPASVQTFIGAFLGIIVVVGPLLLALGLFIQVIGFAIAGLGSLALIIPGIISAVGALGSAITGIVGVVGAIIGVFGSWAIIIGVLVAALVFLAIEVVKHWDQIKAKITEAINAIVLKFNAFIKFFTDAWKGFTDLVSGVLAGIKASIVSFLTSALNLWNSFFDGLFKLFDDLLEKAKSVLDKVINWLEKVITNAAKGARAITDAAGATSSAPGLARGTNSPLRGPGTSTSDSILSWLSNGEMVIQARAVRKYGASVFAALNGMRLPRGSLPGFAMGGLVGAVGNMPSIRLPDVGLAPALGGTRTPINLNIFGETFENLLAPEDTAAKLARFARTRQLRSAGRSPYWRGGS